MQDNVLFITPPAPERLREGLTEEQRAALETINRKIAAGQSLDEMLSFLFAASRSLCPCDRIGLSFLEEDGLRVRAYHAVADYEPLLLNKGYAETLQGSSLAEVINKGSVRIIRDLEAYLRAHPDSASTKIVLKEGVRSSMTCPLVVDGRNVGLLFRSSRQPDAFGEQDALLHLAVAERLSQAVEKAYRIEQLQAAMDAYTEMLGFVSHELKSPVASLVTDANMMLGGYLGEMSDEQRRKIERMVAKGEYLLGLVREYLDLARIEGGSLEPNFAPIKDFIAEVIEPTIDIVQPQIDEKVVQLQRDFTATALPAEGDVNLLKIVLVNLLSNAVKYGEDHGEIRVRVAAENDLLRVAVWNRGPGFPAGQKAKLFRKFSRLDTPELKKRKGTGVGLYTTWRIVELHGGRIAAESEPGRWAEFTFTIPRTLPAAVKERKGS